MSASALLSAYDEFKKGMVEMKLHLSEADMTRVFRKFDGDGSGFISFDELLMGLRGQLSERRGDMVARCFKVGNKVMSIRAGQRIYPAAP